jgi:hypothetical protein
MTKSRRSKLNLEMDKARKEGGIIHVPAGTYVIRGGSPGIWGLADGDLIRVRKPSKICTERRPGDSRTRCQRDALHRGDCRSRVRTPSGQMKTFGWKRK